MNIRYVAVMTASDITSKLFEEETNSAKHKAPALLFLLVLSCCALQAHGDVVHQTLSDRRFQREV